VLGAGVLAPLAYYPAYLKWGGEPRLGSYAKAWLTLANWSAGPAWFLWVLLVFDCIGVLSFMGVPRAVEEIVCGVGAFSKPPVFLFLMLGTMSLAVYAPMVMRFGPLTWWSWVTLCSADRPHIALLCVFRGWCLPGGIWDGNQTI
jgi:hypothetical protein